VRIKISGCPNSCGQHHVAGIGLYGGARKFHDEQVPTYQLLLGATLAPGRARFGKPMARVPARQVPEAVKALLELYRAERKPEETFDVFVDRTERGRLRSVLAPWTELPPSSETPEKYLDWGSDEKFKLETGTGECAA
jgi:sulfite reductase beta subunit-like hemoprotein